MDLGCPGLRRYNKRPFIEASQTGAVCATTLNRYCALTSANSKLEFHPLTPERWRDFESLFGERGACGGCWCMWPRLSRSQYETQKGARNKRAMKKLVDGGSTP